MNAAYRRESGPSVAASRRHYAGTFTRSRTDRRTAGHLNEGDFQPSRSSFVTTGSLIVFVLALTLTAHFLLLNRAKQKLGF
jgi:hypothetical protein